MKNINLKNKSLVWLASGTAALGLGLGVTSIASAATTGSSNSNNTTTQAPQQDHAQRQMQDPASMPNGPGETALTGSTLTKVEAAVKAAEPGATIIRAETDSGGHTYEAHIKLADGTTKTLYFTSNFAADGSDTGFGAPPAGQVGQQGQPPMGQPGQAPTQQGSTNGTQASN